jgi:hypothetical protein
MILGLRALVRGVVPTIGGSRLLLIALCVAAVGDAGAYRGDGWELGSQISPPSSSSRCRSSSRARCGSATCWCTGAPGRAGSGGSYWRQAQPGRCRWGFPTIGRTGCWSRSRLALQCSQSSLHVARGRLLFRQRGCVDGGRGGRRDPRER